jgi:DNA-binding transcriptional MerR regulator
MDLTDVATMRIGELAARAGVSTRALRYYEEQGLLRPVRSESGQRRYDESAVEYVRFFQQMYAAGLSSGNIARLLPCMQRGHTDAEQRAMLRAQRERIAERVATLSVALGRLDQIIETTATHPA